MTLTPTQFSWPAGPGAVQVSGDWDEWKDKVELNKQDDGSFEKEIALPENKRVHFKYIVDGNWTTKSDFPTVDDAGNVNNIIDVGPAPAVEAKTAAATTTAATTAAVGGAAVVGGVTAAGSDRKKTIAETTSTKAVDEAPAATKETEKKSEPISAVKTVNGSDEQNTLPSTLTAATHAAVPVLASTVATVTGADIFRGHPEALPADANTVPADQAPKSTTASAAAPATTAGAETAKAATASSAAPTVPVSDSGFAANFDAARAGEGKEGGAAAGAIASAGLSEAQTSAQPATKSAAAPVTAAATPAAAPAAASSAAPATENKTLPTTPTKASKAKTAEAPSTPVNGKGTVKDKKGTIRSQLKASEASSDGAVNEPIEHKRKQSLFGKIKNAFSPHSSPSK